MPVGGEIKGTVLVRISTTATPTTTSTRSATAGVTINASAKGHFTYFAIANVTISASASAQRIINGTANIGVEITASASGEAGTTHAGAASCQVNLSISAYADNPAGDFYYNAWEVDSSNALIVTTKRDDADDNYEIYASGNGMFLGYGGTATGGFGNIAEIIVIDSYVSLELRDKIEGYLLHKWNIVDQATSGSHTYFDSAPSWTPADITTKLWLDANDSSTITTTSSGGYDYVTQWNDKSGNGEHAIQNTSSARPWTETHSILGSTIRFGEQDHLENSTFSDLLSSSGFSVFAAYHCRISGSGNAVLWLTGDTNSAGNVEIVEQLSGHFRNRIRGGNGGYHYTPQTGSETFRNKIQVISSLFKGKLRNVVTGTASCQVNLSATASGTASQTHSGTASCQVNLSASASGTVSTPWANSYSIDLDGTNDYVNVDTFDPYDQIGTGDFTISLWVKPDSVHSAVISSWLDGTSNDYGQCRLVLRADGKWRISWKGTSGTNLNTDSTATYSAGNWYNVIVTRSGQQCYVYVNDSQIISVNATQVATGFVDNGEFNIGRYRRSYNGSWLNGHVDEYAIWDEVLTSAERTAIYNSGTPIDLTSDSGNYASSANLVGYWRFEENSGTSIADSSTNSNTATLTNGPTFSTDTP